MVYVYVIWQTDKYMLNSVTRRFKGILLVVFVCGQDLNLWHLTWMTRIIIIIKISTHLLHSDGTNMETARHCQAQRWIPPEPKNTLFYCSILLERQAQTSPAGCPHQRSQWSLTLCFLHCHRHLAKAASTSKTVGGQREKSKKIVKIWSST